MPDDRNRATAAKNRPWVIENLPMPGGRIADLVTEGDPDSRPVSHHRMVDTIGLLERNSTITHEMALAAQAFALDFRAAHLAGIRTSALLRIDTSRHAEGADRSRRRPAARPARLRGPRRNGRPGRLRRCFTW